MSFSMRVFLNPCLWGQQLPLQGKGKGEEEEKVEDRVTSVFIPSIEAAVQEFVAKWVWFVLPGP